MQRIEESGRKLDANSEELAEAILSCYRSQDDKQLVALVRAYELWTVKHSVDPPYAWECTEENFFAWSQMADYLRQGVDPSLIGVKAASLDDDIPNGLVSKWFAEIIRY